MYHVLTDKEFKNRKPYRMEEDYIRLNAMIDLYLYNMNVKCIHDEGGPSVCNNCPLAGKVVGNGISLCPRKQAYNK